MILSASKRTDIPNYYSDWFFNRIKVGFLYVKNPMNANQISEINVSKDVVDCIVFWTKNPTPMLERLPEIDDYMYYFQYTITGYGKDVEPGLPDKKEVLIPTFIKLAEKIGKKRMIWRYDPILLNHKYDINYHLHAFEEIAKKLNGYTEKVVISFLDRYAKINANMNKLNVLDFTDEIMFEIAEKIAIIARKYDLTVETCAEKIVLQDFGIKKGSCIDKALIEELIGCELNVGNGVRSPGSACGCFANHDIGTPDSCRTGCTYCYATTHGKVNNCAKMYDPNSPLLCGVIGENAKITIRPVKSLKGKQIRLFE